MRHNGPVTAFADRHIGPDETGIDTMLAAVGYPSLAALVEAAVPASIRQDDVLVLPPARDEHETLGALQGFAQRNRVQISMIGQGYYDTVTPMVIRRNVLENPAWYTAYTPYQAEISQGRLEAMLNFQTMVSDLTALPVAGASLLDEATAVGEAVLLMRRAVADKEGGVVILDAECHPQTDRGRRRSGRRDRLAFACGSARRRLASARRPCWPWSFSSQAARGWSAKSADSSMLRTPSERW